MRLYILVNYTTCGWCRKFKPVLESVLAHVHPRDRAMISVVELDSPAGEAERQRLGFTGGIPCLLVQVDGREVAREAGYKDSAAFSRWLFEVFRRYRRIEGGD